MPRPPVLVRLTGAIERRLAVLAVPGVALTSGAIALGAGAVAGPAVAIAAGCVALVGGVGLRSAVRTTGVRRRRTQALTAARTVRAEVGAGIAPATALAAAATAAPMHAPALREAAAHLDKGADGSAALIAVPELAGLGHAFRVSAESGASTGSVLDAVVRDLVAARDRDDSVATALAASRASAGLLAGLPVVGVALGVAMGADPIGVLFGSAAGRMVGAVGVVLDCAGLAWTMRIVARARDAPARDVPLREAPNGDGPIWAGG